MRKHAWGLMVLILVLVLTGCSGLESGSPEPKIVSVSIKFDNYFNGRYWYSGSVTLRNDGGNGDVTLRIVGAKMVNGQLVTETLLESTSRMDARREQVWPVLFSSETKRQAVTVETWAGTRLVDSWTVAVQ